MIRTTRVRPLLWLVVPVLLGGVGVAVADTVRLRSGDVVEGKVDDLGDRLRVETPGGGVTLRWKDVECVLPGKTTADVFAEKRKAVREGDAAGLYALALWARRAGLAEESRGCLEAALASDPEHAGAREALAQQKAGGTWLEGSRLLEAKGFVAKDGQWMLREEAELRERQAESLRELTVDEKRVEALLDQAGRGPEAGRKFAVDALSKLEPSVLLRPAFRALRRGEPGSRAAAAKVLGFVKDDTDVLRPLLRSALLDRDAGVRLAAATALKETGSPDVMKPLARAMWSEAPGLRANGIDAVGAVGGAQAVEYLLLRLMSSGGPGARNHIFVGSQVTYVSDFDVEIAQAAQIGDPIVQTVRDGAMLDARVLHTREEFTVLERRTVFLTLTKITGKEFGEDAAAWKTWFDSEGRKAMTAAR